LSSILIANSAQDEAVLTLRVAAWLLLGLSAVLFFQQEWFVRAALLV